MVEISEGKYEHLQKIGDERGVIKAAAMDQRGSLFRRLAEELGTEVSEVTDRMIVEFKQAVSEELTPNASAILLDPEWGMEGVRGRASETGVIMSYEKSSRNRRYADVYTHKLPRKLGELLPDWCVRKSVENDANAVKLLIRYNPDEDPLYNDVHEAMVERVGAECAHYDIPFFLEFVGYDLEGRDWKNDPEVARLKPDVVTRSIEEFSRERYGVDVLKVEIPINLRYTEGTEAYVGENAAYDRSEALEHYRRTDEAAEKPLIYLSAGVNAEEFRESLRLANEAGIGWHGVLCGRATWQEGISVYATDGVEAFRKWLAGPGTENLEAMNRIIDEGAHPWYEAYGGRDNINVV